MDARPVEQLKSHVRLFVGVILAAVVGVSAWYVVAERANAFARAERQSAGFARALAEHSESAFSESDRMVRDLQHEIWRSGGIDRVDRAELFRDLKRQAEGARQVGSIFMVDRKGEMFVNSNSFSGKPIDVSDRDYFRFYASRPDADLAIGRPVMSRLVNRWRFNLMRPLGRPGEPFGGIAAVAFEVDYFAKFFEPSSLGPRGRVLLIHENGTPLVYEPYVDNAYAADFRKSRLFLEKLPNAAAGTYRTSASMVDKAPRIISYRRLSRFPVIAVVSLHQGDVLAPWRQRAIRQGALTAALCLVVVLLTRLTFHHLDRLRKAQEKLGDHLEILEEMAAGVPLGNLLDRILRFVEAQSPGAIGSVLLADETGTRLRHGAAPSLPDEYNRAVDGLRIGEGKGACGTAAHLRKRVVVEDITDHPWWNGFDAHRKAGLRSAWSEPLISPEGDLLGTLAIYHREPRAPGDAEIALIESAAHLITIAVGRVRSQEREHRLEEQLRHIQKIEAIGQLAGGVAHDFNNLLTPILVSAELARRTLRAGDPLNGRMDSILSAAHKAKDLTQKLLSFARKQMLSVAPIDLNRIIVEFQEILRRTIGENVSIEFRPSPGTAVILGDQGQVEQVLVNLAVNAQDAIDGHGRITLETGKMTMDDEFVKGNPGTKAGPHVFLSVSDDGCGMSEEVMKHVFEPFFTTKPVGQGTGLGLATVYGIVKQHEGYVRVESRPGAGTRFTLYFPDRGLAEAGAGPGLPVREADAMPAMTRDILVAEDNDMVRALIVGMLETVGHRVRAVDLPSKALEVAADASVPIDLLVSDVVMPEMNGQDLFRRVRAIRPGLPVLFISGYAADAVLPSESPSAGVRFLKKPFTLEDFLSGVRASLEPA